MSEKVCECGHPLSEHEDDGVSLACLMCDCKAFVWETGDEESDPMSPAFIDWGKS